MPEAPSANMSLVLPTEGEDPGSWDQHLNDALALVDSHDHTTGKGVRVPTAGMRINADLTFADAGSYSAATNVKAVDFQPHAASAMTAYAGALFVNSSDSNNLYFRTQAGSNVRITNGSTLDLTVVGGIGGDYAAIPAELNYVDASDSYTFRQTSAGDWARVHCSSVRLAEHNTTEATYIELAAPSVLASSYTITPASALPASTSIVQISSTGALTYSNDTVHGNRTLVIRALSGTLGNGTSGVSGGSGPYFVLGGGAGDFWLLDIPLPVGKRIRSLQWYYQRSSGTLTFDLRKSTLATGSETSIASTTSASGTSYTSITQSSVDYTLLATESYYLRWTTGAAGDRLYDVVVTYDHP